jgi:hypothetical protein
MRIQRAALPCLIVCLVVLSAAAIRIRLLDIPLERDEGEYAYAGQLLLEGIPPYKLAWNMKLPGTYAAYAGIMAAFGQTIAGIHLGLLLVNAGAIVLLFLLGRRLFGTVAGLVACASYALLSVGAGVLGTQAHATHFVVLPALAGTLLLLKADDSGRAGTLFWSGFLFGLAFLMKQPGIFFAVFGSLYLLWRTRSWQKLTLFVLAAALPFGLTCLMLWRAGVFDRFWFWTFTYAQEYGSDVFLSEAPVILAAMVKRVAQANLLLWWLAAAGLVLAYWSGNTRPRAKFATGFFVFSFLAVCPGFYFREHYFVLLLPAVALLVGVAIGSARDLLESTSLNSGLPLCLFVAALVYSVAGQRQFLFRMTPVQACRAEYGINPFPEAVEVAKYIREHSGKDARIAVLGSEPEICFYAARHSASGYIYTFALMEDQPYALDMQKEFIRDIEAARPEYAVMVAIPYSWLVRPSSEHLVFDWWRDYGPAHYTAVGFADLISSGQTAYTWDAAQRLRQSPLNLTVFKRTD